MSGVSNHVAATRDTQSRRRESPLRQSSTGKRQDDTQTGYGRDNTDASGKEPPQSHNRPPSGKTSTLGADKHKVQLEHLERPTSKGSEACDTPTPTAAANALDTPKNEETVIRTRDGQPIVEVSDTKLDQYDVVKAIGKGKFSTVYRARKKSDGQLVALKKIQIFDMMDDKSREKCFREISLVNSLGHENIIAYLESFIVNKELILVFEYAEAGDLKRQLRKAREREARFDERVIWRYFAQIADAVAHMHERRVMHRDLKPANIFLTRDGKVKVGDLGLGRFLSEHTLEAFSKVGTPLYMSPEVLQGKGYEWSSDVWSLGCLLYELAMLRSPFKEEGLNLYGLFQKITKGSYPPISSVYTNDLRELVDEMLQSDPSKRPGARYVAQKAHEMEEKLANENEQTTKNVAESKEESLSNDANKETEKLTTQKVESEQQIMQGSEPPSTGPTEEAKTSEKDMNGATIQQQHDQPEDAAALSGTQTDKKKEETVNLTAQQHRSLPSTSGSGSMVTGKSVVSSQSPTRTTESKTFTTQAGCNVPTTTTEKYRSGGKGRSRSRQKEKRNDADPDPNNKAATGDTMNGPLQPHHSFTNGRSHAGTKSRETTQVDLGKTENDQKDMDINGNLSEGKDDRKVAKTNRSAVGAEFDTVALSHHLFNNLTSLSFEQRFCQQLGISVLPHFYFATPFNDRDKSRSTQPGQSNVEQLSLFVHLASWLYSLIVGSNGSQGDVKRDNFGLGDDLAVHSPYALAGAVLQKLNELKTTNSEELPELRPHRVAKGYGGDCAFVLWWLSSIAVKNQSVNWDGPTFDISPTEVLPVEGDDIEFDEDDELSDDTEEVMYADIIDPEVTDAETSQSKHLETLNAHVDPKEWEKEVERVVPRLRREVKHSSLGSGGKVSSDWRKHVENINLLSERLGVQNSSTVGSTEMMSKNVMSSLSTLANAYEEVARRIRDAENFINRTYTSGDSSMLNQLANLRKQESEYQSRLENHQQSLQGLSSKLSNVEDQLEEINTELQSKGEGMSDTNPVQNLRIALTKLQRENRDLDIRVGISLQRLDFIRIRTCNSKYNGGDDFAEDDYVSE